MTSLVAVATNRRGKVFGYYCARHQPRILRTTLICWGLAVVAFCVAATGGHFGIFGLFMAGALPGIFLLVIPVRFIAGPTLWFECKRIEEDQIWLKPLSDAYLDSFPESGDTPRPKGRG